MSDGESPHHFEFDLDRGIRDQVVEKLEASPLLSLEKNIGPTLSGIYVLYFKGDLVYLGKASRGSTKSKRTLRSRLNEQSGRSAVGRISRSRQMKCRYLTFSSEWWVFAAEFALDLALPAAMELQRLRQQSAWRRSPGNASD